MCLHAKCLRESDQKGRLAKQQITNDVLGVLTCACFFSRASAYGHSLKIILVCSVLHCGSTGYLFDTETPPELSNKIN